MKIEQAIFKSKVWNYLKDKIPPPLRSLLSFAVLKIKRWHYAFNCLISNRNYLRNWVLVAIQEVVLPKGTHIRYQLKENLQNRSLTIRAKSFDKFIVNEVYSGSYEIALKKLPDSPVIIDAGAHIGVFAVKALGSCPQARLFCIEPIAANLRLLRKNLEDNNLSRRVTVLESLLSNNDGLKTIYERKDHSAGFNLYLPTDVKYDIQSRTLESVVRDNKITHCDLLKMDIEGGEYEVLLNTPPQVFEKIQSIVMEYHPFPKDVADIQGLADFLSKNGYSVNFYSHKMLYATR